MKLAHLFCQTQERMFAEPGFDLKTHRLIARIAATELCMFRRTFVVNFMLWGIHSRTKNLFVYNILYTESNTQSNVSTTKRPGHSIWFNTR